MTAPRLLPGTVQLCSSAHQEPRGAAPRQERYCRTSFPSTCQWRGHTRNLRAIINWSPHQDMFPPHQPADLWLSSPLPHKKINFSFLVLPDNSLGLAAARARFTVAPVWCFSHLARILLQLSKVSELLIDQVLADSSGGQ